VYIALLVFEVERVGFRLALVAMASGLAYTLLQHWRTRRTREARATIADDAWPRVTIQLPLRNERQVAERVIRAASAIDYPRDRLAIQVLDDSEDETVALVDEAVATARRSGIDISAVRRSDRRGFKAGHLSFGMARSEAEYFAVFDADFIPPPEFLRRTIPILVADARIGFVQTRWAFLNRNDSLLTRAQAMVLDGLMLVEQPTKSARRGPFQFNGTAGVWRRACIDGAGGWRFDSVVEDLDLSFRAFMTGWRFVHLVDLAVPAELPVSMRAFRVQQRRWTRGNAQVLRALSVRILRSDIRRWHRGSMLMHLGGRLIYVLLAILTLSMPLTTFGWIHPLVNYSLLGDALMLLLVSSVLALYQMRAERDAAQSPLHAVLMVPVVLGLHIGMSFCCATAFVSGLLSTDATFVRTPKTGGGGARYRSPFDVACLVELLVGTAYVLLTVDAAMHHYFAISLFFAFFCVSYLWVGIASLKR
jgi:cellulose synthase/poly-beta-1,6-N-acetylglucosamine synthase-like glycosyltransferase